MLLYLHTNGGFVTGLYTFCMWRFFSSYSMNVFIACVLFYVSGKNWNWMCELEIYLYTRIYETLHIQDVKENVCEDSA